MLPVGRDDLAVPHFPGHGVQIVEGDLLPVNVEPALTMGIGTSSSSRGAPDPCTRMLTQLTVTHLSWEGLPRGQQPRPAHPVTTRARRCMSSFLLHESTLRSGM